MTSTQGMKSNASSSTMSSSIASTSQNQQNNESKLINGNSKPTVYELNPPIWRPRLHPGSRSIGAPDIYIRRSNEPEPPEDELSENNVRNGLHARPAVGNETFSAHDMIYDRLKGKSVVVQLGQLFDEVVQRRQQLAGLRCGPSISQYRQPQRVTLNEVKLAAYIKELADPSVPIRKLAKSVPHGYRGERMLDMLWNGGSLSGAMAAMKSQSSIGNNSSTNNGNSHSSSIDRQTKHNNHTGLANSVEIPRAVWFVRVVGASEISSSRLRQGNSAQYTSEWTTTLMNWLRRQIVELNIAHHHNHTTAESPATPSSPMASRVRQQTNTSTPQRLEEPYALILEDDFRDRWMAKWSYSLALLRALANEGLIDCQVAARSSIDMFRTANIVQLFILLALVQEFLDVISNSITLSHFALDVLSAKLKDFEESSANQTMRSSLTIRDEIHSTVLYLFDSRPESFVSPSCWSRLSPIISSAREDTSARTTLQLIKERNEKLFSGLIDLSTDDNNRSNDYSRLESIKILDQITNTKDIQTTFESYFGRNSETSSEKVRSLLIWATTEWRIGTHRPFAAATLLCMYIHHQPSRSQKRGMQRLKDGRRIILDRIDLDAIIMSWITDVDLAMKRLNSEQMNGFNPSQKMIRWNDVLQTSSLSEMVILIGELCRLGCFSFQKYLQRLTARGLTASGVRENRIGNEGVITSNGINGRNNESLTSDSIPSKLLRSIPLNNPSIPLEHQRRLAIYGNRAKESWEEAMERRALRELGLSFTWLGEIKAEDQLSKEDQASFDLDELVRFWTSSRYIRNRIISLHLLPSFKEYIREEELKEDQFIKFANLLIRAEEFAALSEILLDIHQNPKVFNDSIHHLARIYTIEHALIWLCMGSPLAEYENEVKDSTEIQTFNTLPDEKLLIALQTSYEAYCEGQKIENNDVIGKSYIGPETFLSVWQKQSSNMFLFIDWASKFLPKDEAAIDMWIMDLIRFAKKDNLDDEQSQIIVKLGVPLMCYSHTKRPRIRMLEEFCLLNLSGFLIDDSGNISQESKIALSFLSTIFLQRELTLKQKLEVNIIKSNWINTNFCKALLRIICALKNAEQTVKDPIISEDMSKIRQVICSENSLKFFVQTNLLECINLIRSNVYGQDVHFLMHELLPLCWPWTSDEEVIAKPSNIFLNLDQWRWNQMLCEISIAVNSLTNRGTTENSNLSELAFLFSENVLSKVDIACSSFAVSSLINSPLMIGAQFFVGLVNERLRLLNKQLEATFTDETLLKAELETLLRLLRNDRSLVVTASGPSVQSMRLVTEWLEGNIPPTPVNEISNSNEEEILTMNEKTNQSITELAVRLGIICFLLKLDNILNNAMIKSIAPRLFCSIISFAVSFSRKSDFNYQNVEIILDVARYVLQQAPLDLQQSMRARAMEQIGANLLIRPCPSDRIGSIIASLINGDPNFVTNTVIQKSSLIEAHSTTSALLDGQFTAVQIKSWDLHPNVETVQLVGSKAGTENTTLLNGNQQQNNTSITGMNSLNNNGPISLHHFGAYRTLDRIPERTPLPLGENKMQSQSTEGSSSSSSKVPQTMISEESYGLHLGGQPIYARDAKRGLLSLHSDSSFSSSGGGSLNEKLSADDLRHLVPALCVKTEKSKAADKATSGGKPSTNKVQTATTKGEKDSKTEKDTTNGTKKKNEKNTTKSATATTGAKADKKAASSSSTANNKGSNTTVTGSKKRKTSNANEQKPAKTTTVASNSRKRAKKT